MAKLSSLVPAALSRAPAALSRHGSTILQVVFGLVTILLAAYFIRHEGAELNAVRELLPRASVGYVAAGLLVSVVYVWLQAEMYRACYRSVGARVSLWSAVVLYLKRNALGLVLPAGGVTNLLFFTEEVERRDGVSKPATYIAGLLHASIGLATGILVIVPGMVYLLAFAGREAGTRGTELALTGLALLVLLAGTTYLGFSIARRGWAYRLLTRYIPGALTTIETLRGHSLAMRGVWTTVAWSFAIEVIGVAHLWIALEALGQPADLTIATAGYAVTLLVLLCSPFLKGVGAVEAALTYALDIFGIGATVALSVAVLYRLFEFWLVLALGILAFVGKRDGLFVRLWPALLLAASGGVTLWTALREAGAARISRSTDLLVPFVAGDHVYGLSLLVGALALATAAYLVRGFRAAWWVAVVTTGASAVGHLLLTDNVGAGVLAGVTCGVLVYAQSRYRLAAPAWASTFPVVRLVGLALGVWLIVSLGWWGLDRVHTGDSLGFGASLLWGGESLLWLDKLGLSTEVRLPTPLGVLYDTAVHGIGLLLGLGAIGYAIYVWPTRPGMPVSEELARARRISAAHGRSTLDYFKTYGDKRLWFAEDGEAFVAYGTARGFAVALEGPVCASAKLATTLAAFDAWAHAQGLRTLYYRLYARDADAFRAAGKRLLPIGEEATVPLATWSLEGTHRKALRNATNKLTKLDYRFAVTPPPVAPGRLRQFRATSDAWLADGDHRELGFSQGYFDEAELAGQTILSVDDPAGAPVAFVNVVPSGRPGEVTFDLIRKHPGAPGGVMDLLFAEMLSYFRRENFATCNIGLVPMSGVTAPQDLAERAVQTAYERLSAFRHYRSLRNFKDEFDPSWEQAYLAYDEPLDLVFVPGALRLVMRVGVGRPLSRG